MTAATSIGVLGLLRCGIAITVRVFIATRSLARSRSSIQRAKVCRAEERDLTGRVGDAAHRLLGTRTPCASRGALPWRVRRGGCASSRHLFLAHVSDLCPTTLEESIPFSSIASPCIVLRSRSAMLPAFVRRSIHSMLARAGVLGLSRCPTRVHRFRGHLNCTRHTHFVSEDVMHALQQRRWRRTDRVALSLSAMQTRLHHPRLSDEQTNDTRGAMGDLGLVHGSSGRPGARRDSIGRSYHANAPDRAPGSDRTPLV